MNQPQEQAGRAKGRSVLLAVGAAVALLVSYGIRNTPANRRASALQSWAQRARTHVPEAIGDELRVVGVQAGRDSVWFELVLPRARKAELDLPAFRKAEEARVHERACTGLRGVLTAGGYLGFQYRDRDGARLPDLYVLPSDCGLEDPGDLFMIQSMRHMAEREAAGEPMVPVPMKAPGDPALPAPAK